MISVYLSELFEGVGHQDIPEENLGGSQKRLRNARLINNKILQFHKKNRRNWHKLVSSSFTKKCQKKAKVTGQ